MSSEFAPRKLDCAGVLNVIAGVFCALLPIKANTASAADMSVAPAPAFLPSPFSWTGFYIGAGSGGGWTSGTLNDSFTGAGLGGSSSGIVGFVEPFPPLRRQ